MQAILLKMNDEEHEKEDRYQHVANQRAIKGMREEVTQLGVWVKEVRDALKGSDLSMDGGLVKRISNLESRVLEMEKKVNANTSNRHEFGKIMRTVYIAIGFVASSLFTWALNHFFPSKK